MIEDVKPAPTAAEISRAIERDRPAWRLAWRSDPTLAASYGDEQTYLAACERSQTARMLRGRKFTR